MSRGRRAIEPVQKGVVIDIDEELGTCRNPQRGEGVEQKVRWNSGGDTLQTCLGQLLLVLLLRTSRFGISCDWGRSEQAETCRQF